MTSDLQQQFEFLSEIERLRQVDRQTLLLDGSRQENSAEHSWHLALYALVFAPYAPPGVSIPRVIQMLLLHDIVEIDVGDHPIDEPTNWTAVAEAEDRAQKRIFDLLPDVQGQALQALWQEFEAAETVDARFAKALDYCQPIFQTLCAVSPPVDHMRVVKENLTTGRATTLKDRFPEAFSAANTLLAGQEIEDEAFAARLAFLSEADRLKTILRASRIAAGTRFENSAEHSWHIMLYGWVLADHSAADIQAHRVLTMLLLHDLVEIDAGDVPIHSKLDADTLARIEAEELAAAQRLFGLLPEAQGEQYLKIWQEFEASQSPDAIYAKSIDRVQPVLLNIATGGGSWIEYDVTLPQIDARVGAKVARGAPKVWDHVRARLLPWFTEHGRL
ncbi:HD domain-containing protein [Tritonibacter scottomollicae]|uniref:HD domain-containing protein n=1 Tax=Tritonibacter scottomollicae TaxID=483013 RepID=A0ABZ0HIU9_TRISK|nr:HD domain-containing protein [Tritonibacter scottomollicae]WOI34206.1 HD domain-containing protein [Tritonibacter scottomollicae]